MLAHSKFGYVCSFKYPPRHIFKLETWGQQNITNGPWQAIPCPLLRNLKTIGFKVQCQSLDTTSLASLVRNATVTITNFAKISGAHAAIQEADPCFLQAYHVQWVENSCLASMRNAIHRVESHGIIVSQVMHSASPQSDLTKAILKHQPYSPNSLFIARLNDLLEIAK